MTTYDAELVGDDYDPSAPDARPFVTCLVCTAPFFIETTHSRGNARKYCCVRCKVAARDIKAFMRSHHPKVPSPLDAFLKDPHTYFVPGKKQPPVPPRRSGATPKTYFEGKTEREKVQASRDSARAVAARQRAKEAEARARTAELQAAASAAGAEERAAIRQTMDALSLVPLSDQKDVMSGKSVFLAETEIANIRAGISVVVRNHIVLAERVMSGELVWSPAQVTLFRALLNKVVPDAAATKVQSSSGRDLSDLSIDELEDLVRAARTIEGATDGERA